MSELTSSEPPLMSVDNQSEDHSLLHTTLQDSFIPLPPAGIELTTDQLHAVFGGDLKALRDLWRLVTHSTIEIGTQDN